MAWDFKIEAASQARLDWILELAELEVAHPRDGRDEARTPPLGGAPGL